MNVLPAARPESAASNDQDGPKLCATATMESDSARAADGVPTPAVETNRKRKSPAVTLGLVIDTPARKRSALISVCRVAVRGVVGWR